jgi:hypothetical protein
MMMKIMAIPKNNMNIPKFPPSNMFLSATEEIIIKRPHVF